MGSSSRIVQLRQAFGLDESEELYGQFSCAHTQPRWGAQFLQGQLYVFSSVMVFHANLLAIIKVERIQFRDVRVIRKRSFMRMPNTIAVSRCDDCGGMRDDVLTSFMFTGRRKAFEVMVARWRAVNPQAADTYLASVSGSGRSTIGLSRGDAGGPNSSGSMSNPQSSCDLDRSSSSGLGTSGLLPSRYNSRRSLSFGPGAPGGLGGVAHFPAWQELPAAVLPAAAGDLALMAAAHVEGVDGKAFAEALLSDTSGFLPAAYKAQGNELVGLSPWQVVSAGRANPSAPPGSLSRTLQYIYSSASAWGTVRSLVVQDQVLLVGEGGRLVLLVTQRMPDLPAGVGKCFYISLRWDITPTAPAAAVSAPAVPAPADHPASPHTPAAHQAGAAAGDGPDLPLLRTPNRGKQQQQVSAAAASSSAQASSTPSAAAAADAAAAAIAGETSGDSFSSGSSSSSLRPLKIPASAGPGTAEDAKEDAATNSANSSSEGSTSSRSGAQSQSPKPEPSDRPLSPAQMNAGLEDMVERLPSHLNDVVTGLKSTIKHSYKVTKQGLRDLRRGSSSKASSPLPPVHSLTGSTSLNQSYSAASAMGALDSNDSEDAVAVREQQAPGNAGLVAAATPTAAAGSGSSDSDDRQQQQQQQQQAQGQDDGGPAAVLEGRFAAAAAGPDSPTLAQQSGAAGHHQQQQQQQAAEDAAGSNAHEDDVLPARDQAPGPQSSSSTSSSTSFATSKSWKLDAIAEGAHPEVHTSQAAAGASDAGSGVPAVSSGVVSPEPSATAASAAAASTDAGAGSSTAGGGEPVAAADSTSAATPATGPRGYAAGNASGAAAGGAAVAARALPILSPVAAPSSPTAAATGTSPRLGHPPTAGKLRKTTPAAAATADPAATASEPALPAAAAAAGAPTAPAKAGTAAPTSGPRAPAAASAPAPAAGGVQWQVRGSVTFTKWHMAQSKVERDCLTTAGQSLTNLVARGVAWLQDEGSRQTLAEVMPQAEAVKAAQRQTALKHGGWPVHRMTSHHRRSGSAGSSSGMRVASSAGSSSGMRVGSSSNTFNRAHLQQSAAVPGLLRTGSSNSAKGLTGSGAGRRPGFAMVLGWILSVLGAGADRALGCGRAVAQVVGSGSVQQWVVLGVLLVVVVQLALLWQVVVLQGRVVQLLERAMRVSGEGL